MSNQYPLIKLSGNPKECGVQHGQAASDQIKHNIEYYLDLWNRICGISKTEALKKAKATAEPIKTYAPDIYEEIEGIAEGSGAKLNEILALNTRYELTWNQIKRIVPGGCTAIGAQPSATQGRHTLIAQNWDYRIGLREGVITLNINQEGKPRIMLNCEAGTVGQKGMNSAGIGLLINAMVSDQDSFAPHPPLLIQCRKALNSSTLAESMQAILGAGRSTSSNLIVAQAGGAIISLEMSPIDTSIITPDRGIIAHTNHFIGPRSLSVKDLFVKLHPNSIYRLTIAKDLMETASGRITTATIQGVLKDHFGKPNSICAHADQNLSEDTQQETLASVIMDLEERSMWISKGPPCTNPYEKQVLE